MKNGNRVFVSALAVLFTFGFFSQAFAARGVGHGGGAEWHVISCEAAPQGGMRLSLSVCLTGEINEFGKYEVIPCGEDSQENVLVERRIRVATDAEMVEVVKIPGRLFDVVWGDELFSLKMNDPIAGDLELVRLGNDDEERGTTLDLNLPSMRHSLKSVSCSFGSN